MIKRIAIRNFKGIHDLTADFSNRTSIYGGNGKGKTSIYQAYLWCLFGKDEKGNAISVQPKDGDNQIVHKVETSVEVQLTVDGRPYSIKRVLKENWRVPTGKTEAELNGTDVKRYVDDVPLSVKDFSERLASICKEKGWFMLSSITAFMGLKQEERRKILNGAAGEMSDEELAAGFPEVLKALRSGKSIDDLQREVKNKRDDYKNELDMIPARIDQQDKLFVDGLDEEALKREKEECELQLRSVEAEISSSVSSDTIKAAEQQRRQLAELNGRLLEMETKAARQETKERDDIMDKVDALNNEIRKAEDQMSQYASESDSLGKDYSELLDKLQDAKNRWMDESGKKFEDTTEKVCLVCGRPYDDSRVEEMRRNAIEHFNVRKAEALESIEAEAVAIKRKMEENKDKSEVLFGKVKGSQEMAASFKSQLNEEKKRFEGIRTKDDILASNPEYQKLKDNIILFKKQIENRDDDAKENVKDELNKRRSTLKGKIEGILCKLTTVATNNRIIRFKKELEGRSTDLAQNIADIDKVMYEIKAFRKQRIEMVESRVSSLFRYVKWKFYEPNLTNDGEKEICVAVMDGKDYASLSQAEKAIAGIDIITGLSKAYGVEVPLFVDNKENIVDYDIDVPMQLITLTAVKGKPLTIEETR